ncbi:ABC transporter ATP-binding protein [Luteimicrobium sp. DT211]|uniref:ABC transporter ATP-binding protein n=1 Tax=Luteimicrobium sp. DT211 TaxID=3393412 RepID=UPI003CF2DF54
MSRTPETGPARAERPSTGDVALRVDGLVKRYAGTAVVDGLSFAARRGAITAVLGPNGAGKTTTVECCEGLRSPDAGSVRVLGLDPLADAAALRPRVGVMLQDGGLPTGVRALEMLEHVARMYADPRDVGELSERLGLGSFARTTVRRLSGGQRQRLALAVAVVGRPELVFLDEPSAGMDPQSRRAVWELVAELRADGVGVVLTTHLMDEAEALADDVLIVDRGKVIAQGSVRELVTDGGGAEGAQHEQTLRLEAAPGLPTDLLRGLELRERAPGQYVTKGVVGPETLVALTQALASRDVLASRVAVGRRTLEDVFLDLTGRNLR